MAEFDALRRKTYSYLRNDDDENKKSKRQKNSVSYKQLKLEYHKYCLEATQLEINMNQFENR